MPSDAEIFKKASGLGKEVKPEVQIIYKTKEVFKNPFNESETKYIKKGLKTYMTTYTNNLTSKKNRGTNPKDSDNYEDLIAAMKVYKKLTGFYYYNKKLYDLLEIKKGEELEK